MQKKAIVKSYIKKSPPRDLDAKVAQSYKREKPYKRFTLYFIVV